MLNERKKYFNREIFSGSIFFLFGIIMLLFIIPATVPVSFVPPGQISPRFLPTVISVAITIIGFLALLLAVFKRKNSMLTMSQTEKEVASDDDKTPRSDNMRNGEEDTFFLRLAPVLSMLIVIAYLFLLIWVGFLISSVFAMLAIMLAFGERRWWVLTIASVVVPISAWVFAVKLLKIPMP
jgi:hypothetical protein